MVSTNSAQAISVLVPRNPFVRAERLQDVKHCLAAIDVEKLMEWWPGSPHTPHRDPAKVKAIQRSLDWKRVAQIAAYLLQEEIIDAPAKLDKYFKEIYQPKKMEPGRVWPPRVPKIVRYEPSEYPTFSNVLLHVNGATISPLENGDERAANLVFDERSANLYFSVIDGQHRINGAYFAIKLLREKNEKRKWDIPAEIYLDLDQRGAPPRHQAQIFIDVNFYQKKVDRSLVADLFPTARGPRSALNDKERAQDIGRKLMLEEGPLKGLIQIPGIKYGVPDVVALATLNGAIEDSLEAMQQSGILGLEEQTEFISQFLESWLDATGRRMDFVTEDRLDPENVVYQGRILVSVINLIPACILELKRMRFRLVSDRSKVHITKWFLELIKHAGWIRSGQFLSKSEFKNKGFLGSGGLGRLRNRLWAALIRNNLSRLSDEKIAQLAEESRDKVYAKFSDQGQLF